MSSNATTAIVTSTSSSNDLTTVIILSSVSGFLFLSLVCFCCCSVGANVVLTCQNFVLAILNRSPIKNQRKSKKDSFKTDLFSK